MTYSPDNKNNNYIYQLVISVRPELYNLIVSNDTFMSSFGPRSIASCVYEINDGKPCGVVFYTQGVTKFFQYAGDPITQDNYAEVITHFVNESMLGRGFDHVTNTLLH